MTAQVVSVLPERRRKGWLLIAGLLLSGATAAAVLLVLTRGEGSVSVEAGRPTEVSVAELRSFAEAVGHVVYWAGAPANRRLELTHNRRGDVFVRYLTGAAAAGDRRPTFTTVATYPRRGAYRETAGAGARTGMVRIDAPGGGVAVWSPRRPTSVYVAYPGSDYLVEVYDPSAKRARGLVLGGDVGPVR